MYNKRKVPISRKQIKTILRQNKKTILKMCLDCSLNYEYVLLCLRRGEIMPAYLNIIADYLDVETESLEC